MLRFSKRPRPLPKEAPKAVPRQRRKARPLPGARRVIDVLLVAVSLVTAARLVSAAVAYPPPVAVPGDIVPLGRAANWMANVNVMNARDLSGAFAAPGRACRLDISRMAQAGGSFTVLAVRADGVMLSWAGGPTAAPGQACAGGATAMLISAGDYRSLLMRVPVVQ
jgi:hypothetical protein